MGITQTPYFDSLFDDFGIWQHTNGTDILREEGYALDDATRGLLFTLMLGRSEQSEVLLSYIQKSRTQNGFYGFAGSDRQFIPATASDDATGQVIWAAGYAYSKNFHHDEVLQLVTDTAAYLDKTEYVRGYAYALLGAVYISQELAEYYYRKLLTFFDGTDDDWPWPEPTLTYGNGIMPYAFLRYGLVYGDKSAVQIGRKILLFLEKCCTQNRQRGPIGNDGWMTKEARVAPVYSQQPIDVAYMIWAWLAAYQISGEASDKENYMAWMRWFEGENIAGGIMYDLQTLKAYDGINPIGADHSDQRGINYHSGAETNVCFLLSKYMIDNNTTI